MDSQEEAIKQLIVQWLGGRYHPDDDGFNPDHFNESEVNELVMDIARTVRLFSMGK